MLGTKQWETVNADSTACEYADFLRPVGGKKATLPDLREIEGWCGVYLDQGCVPFCRKYS